MFTEGKMFPSLLRSLLLIIIPTRDERLFSANIWYKDGIKPSDRD